MKNRINLCVLLAASVTLLCSCSSLTLEHVEFGWPVESVLTVDTMNMVEDGHHALSFSVTKLAQEEFQDTTALRGKQVRLLRNSEGYYFLTGPAFRNVYIFRPGTRELILKNKIQISSTGLVDPALNQRPPYVELIDGKSLRKNLTSDDIVEGSK